MKRELGYVLRWTVAVLLAALVLMTAGTIGALVAIHREPPVRVQIPGYYLGPSFGLELGGPHASGWTCSGGTLAGHPGEIDGISCSLTSGPGT